jgi:hypothetical protein
MKIALRLGAGLAVLLALTTLVFWSAGRDPFREPERPRTIPRAERASASRQILFGDLHVHTTFSLDAFWMSLPTVGGEGSHPPADACDFARYCSALDFWSITDHDFSLTPERWRETIDSIRQCNAVASDPKNPDTVAFLGWEWTQVGLTPEDHYGHKNVILEGTGDDEIPTRPIAASDSSLSGAGATPSADRPVCDPTANVRNLPPDCLESAPTPAILFRKLREWGFPTLVIPHGTTWGFYTPPGASWDKQLAGDMHDPERQRLIELYSGHGDSEVYRDWREVELGTDGSLTCPAPRPDYLATCWRAGEIIRSRCLAAGEHADECETRAIEARGHAVAAGLAEHRSVPGAQPEDWLDAGQCRDCREPAFNYRPRSSAQYILALGNFAEGEPRHFQLGLLASSDNHSARPGTGYKEIHRRSFTDSRSPRAPGPGSGRPVEAPEPRSRAVVLDDLGPSRFETERQASYFMTGGLVAVHANGRDRDSIWAALERREVYGTTRPRILLWFELLNPPASSDPEAAPMGSVVELAGAPVFRARAVGSFEQLPGCPEESASALGAQELERICRGECYRPSDLRRRITRIEVVRIRPQQSPDEPMAKLIDDPWKVFPCEPDPAGCTASFSDPDFVASARAALYYVRAFEEEAPAINASGARCERDAGGECVKVKLCGPDPQDDCLALREPRAWSSPIWVGRRSQRKRPARSDLRRQLRQGCCGARGGWRMRR